jgi:hypothetical protein
MPTRKASGKLSSDRSESPSALRPSWVKPMFTVNRPASCSAQRTFTRLAAARNHARAFSPSWNFTKMCRPYLIRIGSTTLSWMSWRLSARSAPVRLPEEVGALIVGIS